MDSIFPSLKKLQIHEYKFLEAKKAQKSVNLIFCNLKKQLKNMHSTVLFQLQEEKKYTYNVSKGGKFKKLFIIKRTQNLQ